MRQSILPQNMPAFFARDARLRAKRCKPQTRRPHQGRQQRGPPAADRGGLVLPLPGAGQSRVAAPARGTAQADPRDRLEGAASALCPLSQARPDELMERVWVGVVVEENNFQVHISALRKALAEEPDSESWIVTVPRRGYRLLRALKPPAANGTAAEPRTPVPKQPSRRNRRASVYGVTSAAEEPMVCRLSAGGRWIRTSGTWRKKPWISAAFRAFRGYRRGS